MSAEETIVVNVKPGRGILERNIITDHAAFSATCEGSVSPILLGVPTNPFWPVS